MKGSLIVVGFFVLGVCLGRLDLAPALLMDSRVTFAALCCLLFCVGMSIGSNDNIVSEFRSLNPRLALLPVATILGSFAGSLVAWLFLQYRGVTDCMAVGSGFAYYSISSIFITQYRGAELGTVALLANIYREILTLLVAPLLAKVFGPLAPISSGVPRPWTLRCLSSRKLVGNNMWWYRSSMVLWSISPCHSSSRCGVCCRK